MAVRNRLIHATPREVWAVLTDGSRYADWVVGTSESRVARGQWPEVGSALEYTVRIGPWTGSGTTVVRHVKAASELELEVDSGPLGTARVAIEIRPWGEQSLVIVDEHPLRGIGGTLHNAALDTLIQVRHRDMLGRLAKVVEESADRQRQSV
ncbi:SRPBCC family protein [Streptomyces sp. ISL-66]|uniref:SRPBCC family protein n=1 Tax=Streptomyces sp. ISL-66 TaxID=2819186 RepID=UPI001BED232E|nr:SRPBCC family protein [Streptomyces sp. ISL-66]MBT2472905.1 SRPBCC family protein [Streptomyces sp. ISL-66]